MDESRVVRVRRPPPEGEGPPFRFGSGYIVREGQVLTAADVLVAADPSVAEDALDTVCIGDRCSVATWAALEAATTPDSIQWVDAKVAAVDPTLDVAVIAVEGVGDGLPPIRFGRLEGDQTMEWSAIGFPNAGLADHERQPEKVRGDVDAITDKFNGRLGMKVVSRIAQPDADGSGWSGVSGAAVFVGTYLIGVVVEDTTLTFKDSLTGLRITKALEHDGGIAQALDGLPVEAVVAAEGSTDVEADVVRVVGDRVSGGVTQWRDRDELRQWLRERLLAGQRITCIYGRPGIGKSAVVAKVLADFEQPDPARSPLEDLDGLVYLSTRTGVAALTPVNVYESIAALAEPEEAQRLAAKWDNLKVEAFSSLWSALRRRRVVVVLDHLDDLQDHETLKLTDDGLVAMLVSAGTTPNPPRIVTTSRQRPTLPPDLLANVQFRELKDGLSAADGVALLRSFSDPDERIGPESDERLAQVVSIVQGVPHGLELVASLASSKHGFIDNLLKSSEPPGEILDEFVSQNYANLDDAGRHIAGLLALARVPLPEPEVPSLLDGMVDATVASDTLGRLIDTRAVSYERNPEPGRVWLHPLDADYVRKSLIDNDAALQIRLDEKLADWYQSTRTPPTSWRSLSDVAPNEREFEHRWRVAREPAEYTAALVPLAEAAIQIARKGEGRRLFAAIARVEGKVTEPAGLLYLEQCRFWAEFFGGSLERAEQAGRNAVELAKTAGAPTDLAEMQLRLGEVLRHRGNGAEAVTVLRSVLQADADHVARATRIFSLFELGLSSCYVRDWSGADAAADQLASEVTADDDATLRALEFDVRSLARLGDHDYDGAISAATDGIAIYADSASQDNVGYLQNVRGLARMYQDDLDAAEKEFKDATDVATQYGQARLEGLCAINLGWCAMSRARWPEAFTLASRAAECLTLVNAKECAIAGQLVSALDEAKQESQTPLREVLNQAATGSRDNADLYSPSADLIARLAQQLAARQGIK